MIDDVQKGMIVAADWGLQQNHLFVIIDIVDDGVLVGEMSIDFTYVRFQTIYNHLKYPNDPGYTSWGIQEVKHNFRLATQKEIDEEKLRIMIL